MPRERNLLDPFCGTGNTCMAARLMKRPSTGIEKDPKYVDIANARIKALHHHVQHDEWKREAETAGK